MENENLISLFSGFKEKLENGEIKTDKDVKNFIESHKKDMSKMPRFCPKCKAIVCRLLMTSHGIMTEERVWNGACYECEDTNFEDETFAEVCGKCGTVLKKEKV